MGGKRESDIQHDILEYLNGQDCCKVVKISLSNEAGTPDIFCVRRGTPILLEVKRDKAAARRAETAQPIQTQRKIEWRDAGAYCETVWDVEQVEKLFGSIRL